MNILYFDAVGGVAGDMLVSALLDCTENLQEAEAYLLGQLKKLPLDPWEWQCNEVKRNGFGGLKIEFLPSELPKERHLEEILKMIAAADFPDAVFTFIERTFVLLAEAEARAHRMPKEKLHFHEVGAVDTILDICATALLINYMGIEKVWASPLPMGQGTVTCAHGEIPLPAPALQALLTEVAVRPSTIKGETVTPTGLALLKAMNAEFGEFPAMKIKAAGVGCGSREGSVPNILRVFLGEAEELPLPKLYRLECAVDDMTGEELGFLWEKLYEAGINDMHYTPIIMKKGRPGIKITVLVNQPSMEKVRQAIFTHTSTLGMTAELIDRFTLDRAYQTITTPLGDVSYKTAEGYGVKKTKAEFEDLKAIADQKGLSLSAVRNIADRQQRREAEAADGEKPND